MSLFGQKKTVHLDVGGMTCGHCVSTVEQALKGVRGVRSVDVDLERNEAVVVADDDADVGALVAAVNETGYEANPRAGA